MGDHRKEIVFLYIYVCILNIITRIRVCYLYCTLIHVCILNIITCIRVCFLVYSQENLFL